MCNLRANVNADHKDPISGPLHLEKVSIEKCNKCFSEGFYKIYGFGEVDVFGPYLHVDPKKYQRDLV